MNKKCVLYALHIMSGNDNIKDVVFLVGMSLPFLNRSLPLQALIRSFLVSLCIVFSSTAATAMLYSGTITYIDPQENLYFFKDRKSGTEFELRYMTTVIAKQVLRLSKGDFISFHGTYDTVRNQLVVETVNYVSLSTLLGIWLGDDNSCYYFESFTKLSVYNANTNGLCDMPMIVAKTKIRKLNYFINPDVSVWYMVISDNQINYAGELLIKNERTIQINLFDEITGDILSKITLRR